MWISVDRAGVNMEIGGSNTDETRALRHAPDHEVGTPTRANFEPTAPGDTPSRRIPRVAPPSTQETPAVERIGRFTVLALIGHGGMGTVYAAYDEQLDRKIAIKISSARELSRPRARLRFQREAQALARLSHPNVVTVYEVGCSKGDVFLAMEFIRGQSLHAWIRTQPDWPQVLEVFIQAGRGLVAAHEAGLVHRDLKPHNIMRGEDGVVKVLDFGLARAASDESCETLDRYETSSSTSALCSSCTSTGTVMGTPAYMAPEQMRGQTADARSDQYSFCVTLYEALYGERPFAERSGAGPDRSASQSGVIAHGVPSWLHRVVARGLSPDPAERWPSMAALLDALSGASRRRRGLRRLALVGVSVLSLGAVGAVTQRAWLPARAQPCTGAADQLAGIWDDTRREQVQAALLGIDRDYARDVWARTHRELDAYASDWVAMHTEACEATATRGEQSPQMLDLRMGCLHRAAVELRAAVDTLADANTKVVANAHELTVGLRALSRCADPDALAAEVEPPMPGEAEAVDAARLELAYAKSQEAAGLYESALAAVEAAEDALAGVEYGPIQTEVTLRKGSVLSKLGKYADSEAALTRALELALQWDQRDLMLEVSHRLMFIVGYKQQRAEEGLRYWPLAKTLSRGHSRSSGHSLVQARAHQVFAIVLHSQGKYEEAEVEFRMALTWIEQILGPDHPRVTNARHNLAIALNAQGRYEEAEAEIRVALALSEEALGSDHPEVVKTRSNLGTILEARGKYEEAEAELRQTLSLMNVTLGPEHPHVATVHTNLGIALRARGKYEEAKAQHRAALSVWEKALGPDHPSIASARTNLANVLYAQGDYEQAEGQHRAALAVLHEALGPDHPKTAATRDSFASVLHAQGKYEEAEAQRRAALSVRLEALDPDHPLVASSRSNLAITLLALDRAAEAVPLSEQAWARMQRDDLPAEKRATVALALARVLWAVDGPARDRPRARALAQDALRSFRAAGEAYDQDAARCQQWLDSHRVP